MVWAPCQSHHFSTAPRRRTLDCEASWQGVWEWSPIQFVRQQWAPLCRRLGNGRDTSPAGARAGRRAEVTGCLCSPVPGTGSGRMQRCVAALSNAHPSPLGIGETAALCSCLSGFLQNLRVQTWSSITTPSQVALGFEWSSPGFPCLYIQICH